MPILMGDRTQSSELRERNANGEVATEQARITHGVVLTAGQVEFDALTVRTPSG
jgi:hypothetical protein